MTPWARSSSGIGACPPDSSWSRWHRHRCVAPNSGPGWTAVAPIRPGRRSRRWPRPGPSGHPAPPAAGRAGPADPTRRAEHPTAAPRPTAAGPGPVPAAPSADLDLTIRPHRPEHSLETSEPGATRAIDIPTGRNTTLPIGRHRSISTTSPLSTDPGLNIFVSSDVDTTFRLGYNWNPRFRGTP